MTRKCLIILPLSMLIFFMPFSAMGGVVDKPSYFTLKGGIYSPQSNDLEEFDTGFNGELSFGYYFHRNFALEIGVGYFQTQASFIGFDPILGVWSEEDKITTVPLTLTAKGVYPTQYVDVFGGAGIGLYFASGESDLLIGAFPFSFDDSDTVFGFHLGLGANFSITENVFFGIEGKYLWAGAKFEEDILGIPVDLDADLDGYTVTANIGFRF